MNKYQIILIWIVFILLTVISYPFYVIVLKLNTKEAFVSTIITLIVLLATALFVSLKNYQKKTRNYSGFDFWFKKLINIIIIIVSIGGIILGAFYFVSYYKEKSILVKLSKINHHIDSSLWIFLNIETANEMLWSSEDYQHKGYKKLNELTFTIKNNSIFDLAEITATLLVSNGKKKKNKGELKYLYNTEIIIPVDLPSHTTKTIVKKLYNFNIIPEEFSWDFFVSGVEVSKEFIEGKSLDDIKRIVGNDTTKLILDNLPDKK